MKRKWVFGIGIAAMIGMVLWMRELASWRPVTIGKTMFSPTRLRFSKDGRWLVADANGAASAFDLPNPHLNSSPGDLRDFDKNYGLETYPRAWFDTYKKQLLFSPAQGRIVALPTGMRNDIELMTFDEGRVKTAWSKARREVYGEQGGKIWIWDWNTGKLKRRVRYANSSQIDAIFSFDGKWLLARAGQANGGRILNCYDVQNGKLASVVTRIRGSYEFGWSPNSQWIWFTDGDGYMNHSFEVVRAPDSKSLWSAECAGPVRWLFDNRIGIVGRRGFSWRDATGRSLTELPGPFQDGPLPNGKQILHWVLSPDEKWIYSCERSGVIRRWRAR